MPTRQLPFSLTVWDLSIVLQNVYYSRPYQLRPTVLKEKPRKRKRMVTTPPTMTSMSNSFQRSFIQNELYTFQIQNKIQFDFTSFEVENESYSQYKDYKRFMESSSEVQIISKLGEGAYGCVYKGCRTSDGMIVAIKVIKIADDEEGLPSTTLRQLTILKTLKHPNIVKLLEEKYMFDVANPRVELHFEFMDQDLARFIRRNKNMSPLTAKKIMKQILQGVHYMHKTKVFHRDLKPHNILINQHYEVKIADFGLGRIVGIRLETMSKEIETLWYRAPELLLGTVKYDLSVDVWSLGCIFYELVEGRVLFQSESELGQIMEIMKQQGTPKISQWPQLKELPYFKPNFPKFNKKPLACKNMDFQGVSLLQKMIAINPKDRISISGALSHGYFDDC